MVWQAHREAEHTKGGNWTCVRACVRACVRTPVTRHDLIYRQLTSEFACSSLDSKSQRGFRRRATSNSGRSASIEQTLRTRKTAGAEGCLTPSLRYVDDLTLNDPSSSSHHDPEVLTGLTSFGSLPPRYQASSSDGASCWPLCSPPAFCWPSSANAAISRLAQCDFVPRLPDKSGPILGRAMRGWEKRVGVEEGVCVRDVRIHRE